MAGEESSAAAVAADPATSTAPLEIDPNVEKTHSQEDVATQGEDEFPSTTKVIGIMSCVYGIMFLGGLVRTHPTRPSRTQGLTVLGPYNCIDSNSRDYQRIQLARRRRLVR